MTSLVFVNTNVFLYARQTNEPLKQPIAQQWLDRLWQDRSGRTSIQVLSEYYWNATRKVKPTLSAQEAWVRVQRLFSWNPPPTDADLMQRGRDIEQRYELSWWDSLIVASAQAQSCILLLTEDLQDRAVYAGVTVRNPFTLAVSEAAVEYVAPPMPARPYRGRGRPKRARSLVNQ